MTTAPPSGRCEYELPTPALGVRPRGPRDLAEERLRGHVGGACKPHDLVSEDRRHDAGVGGGIEIREPKRASRNPLACPAILRGLPRRDA